MKLFELYNKRKSKSLTESIKMCKSAIALLEADDIEWEPQPQMKGVKGITTDTGPGMKASRAAKQKTGNEQLNTLWKKLVSRAKGMSGVEFQKLKPHMVKVAKHAAQRGLTLSPNPDATLGLGESSSRNLEQNADWQTKARGSNEDEYQIYLDLADDGKGGDSTRGGAPLKSYDEWLNS